MTESPPSARRASLIAALKAAHDFPARYTFKVVGENTTAFTALVLQLFDHVLPDQQPRVTTRQTRSGRHLAITVVATVPSAEEVADLHAALGALPGVVVVL